MNDNREDVLISRVVDRDDVPSDWQELDELAKSDGRVWSELLSAVRQDAAVRAAFDPVWKAVAGGSTAVESVPRIRSFPFAWLGWVAALVVGCLWLFDANAIDQEPLDGAATIPVASRAGESEGSVLGELDRVVLEARPTADRTGFEVVYVRRIVERAIVGELYEIGENEHGEPVPSRVSLASFEPPATY